MDPAEIGPDEFDPSDSYRENGCSFARPDLCAAVREYFDEEGDFDPPGDGAAAIPEPAAALLFAAGFAAVGWRLRKRA